MDILSPFFERFLPIIEDDLKLVLRPPDHSPPLFYRMLHYHMGWVDQAGQPAQADRGKRIRPVLCLLSSEATNGDHRPGGPSAAAVELLHNFSLLHDDIEDRSPTRRGRPTLWCIWGEAQAINAGDALFALAHLAIPRLTPTEYDQSLVAMLMQTLTETCLELTRGQHLDLVFETRDHVSMDDYLGMIAGKTAALISAAAHMGSSAAGADPAIQAHYRAFGENLGMAFQVRDDILDIWGDPTVTGKEIATDIRQRKKSLPVLYALERSDELHDLYTDPTSFDGATIARAITLLDQFGAREYAEELVQQYSNQTLFHLEAASPQGDAGQALYELVHTLLHRDH